MRRCPISMISATGKPTDDKEKDDKEKEDEKS